MAEQVTGHARYNDPRAFDAPPDSSWGKLLALVPAGARVLDVGCAWGAFAAALKSRKSCTVIGVEMDPVAAEAARSRCDEVYLGDVSTLVDRLPRELDVIVAADVLEHLLEPGEVLRRLAPLLRRGGLLLASIPNVTHASIVLELISGRFPRSSEGLLDSDHV